MVKWRVALIFINSNINSTLASNINTPSKSRKIILSLAKSFKSAPKQTGLDNPTTRHEFLRAELQDLQVRKTNGDFSYRGGEEDFQNAWNNSQTNNV